jgi:hypothetical protein
MDWMALLVHSHDSQLVQLVEIILVVTLMIKIQM